MKNVNWEMKLNRKNKFDCERFFKEVREEGVLLGIINSGIHGKGSVVFVDTTVYKEIVNMKDKADVTDDYLYFFGEADRALEHHPIHGYGTTGAVVDYSKYLIAILNDQQAGTLMNKTRKTIGKWKKKHKKTIKVNFSGVC